MLGFWFVNSGLSYSDDVVVMRVAFNNFLFDSSDGTINVEDINMNTDTAPEIMGAPLFYPNPFRFSNVNTQTGDVGASYIISYLRQWIKESFMRRALAKLSLIKL